MTQEEKQLLLKYLCASLPYGVKILHKGWNYEWDDELSTVERVVGIDEDTIYTKVIDTHNGEEYRDDKWPIDTFDDKLFLRPISSMTEEEKREIYDWLVENDVDWFDFSKLRLDEILISFNSSWLLVNWLLKNHFDFMGLIPEGLAIEVTDKNNPYEN